MSTLAELRNELADAQAAVGHQNRTAPSDVARTRELESGRDALAARVAATEAAVGAEIARLRTALESLDEADARFSKWTVIDIRTDVVIKKGVM